MISNRRNRSPVGAGRTRVTGEEGKVASLCGSGTVAALEPIPVSEICATADLPTMSAWESVPPFLLITIMISAMGGLPAAIHTFAYGKPKAVGLDTWDRKLLKRDAAVEAYYKELAALKK